MSRTTTTILIAFVAAALVAALAASADDHGPVTPDDWDGDGILDEFDNCLEEPNGTLLGLSDVATVPTT